METASYTSGQLTARLLKLAWRFRSSVLTALAIQVVVLVLMLGGLNFIGLGVDVIGQGLDPQRYRAPSWPLGLEPPADWSAIRKVALVGGLILGFGLLSFVLDRAFRLKIAALVQDVVTSLRTQTYDKLQRLSFRFLDGNASSSMINRVTGDVQLVRMFVDQVLVQCLVLLVSSVFYAAFMLSLHPTLAVACLLTTPLLWVGTVLFSRTVRPRYVKLRRLNDRTVSVLTENAAGVHVVKGFSRQDLEVAKFARASQDAADFACRTAEVVSRWVPSLQWLPQVNLAVLLVYGGWIYANDERFTLGTLIVFSGLLQQFAVQIGSLAQIANSVQASLTGAARVFEVLDAPIDIQDPPSPLPLERARGEVAFDGVGFGYNATSGEAGVLQGVSFRVEPGQTVALLGATGAGKSTLLSLIPRFYDPDRGVVLIDGQDVRRYAVDDLRRNIGLVFQESFLFSTSIAENIAFGHPGATMQQIEAAARVAAAHDFITRDLSHGYDTVLGERGDSLSGGQRQRIAIARAVLLDPPILLMDDPTAAIDPETEHEILTAMDQAMQDRTTFVVAHRMSTLRRADLVLVLEQGRVTEVGTPEALLAAGGTFSGAAASQAADEQSKRLLGMLPEAPHAGPARDGGVS